MGRKIEVDDIQDEVKDALEQVGDTSKQVAKATKKMAKRARKNMMSSPWMQVFAAIGFMAIGAIVIPAFWGLFAEAPNLRRYLRMSRM